MKRPGIALQLLIILASTPFNAQADGKTYSFGVINQRSITLTAEYWNPILGYISGKSGVPLKLKMARTAPESSKMIGRAEFDFVYSNAIFSPENTPAGYKIFARPGGESIRGQIVVLEDTPVFALTGLEGKDVCFPALTIFVGYLLPMNALLQAGVKVSPLFAGNLEGCMAQLKNRRVLAAGGNSQVILQYAQRAGLKYRVLWESGDYLNLPISAHPSIPRHIVAAVRSAFLGMASDPDGRKILAASSVVIKQKSPYGFVQAQDREYANYRKFYQHNLVREITK
jgi:phosphonate transport system substrate-binding protein